MRAVPESVEVEVARSVTMAPNERRTLTVRIVNQWTFDVVLVAYVTRCSSRCCVHSASPTLTRPFYPSFLSRY